MFGLPERTVFGQRIPKQKFYERLDVSSRLKRLFIDQVKNIYWVHKIASATTNIAQGEAVREIEVLQINLAQPDLDETVLLELDRAIPYHMLFVLSYEDKVKLVAGYKEKAKSGNKAFKVSGFYYTDWLEETDFEFELNGITLDEVYENLLRKIGGERLEQKDDEPIAATIRRDEEIRQLEKEIATLKMRRKRLKQLNKQIQLNNRIRALMNRVEQLK